MFQGIHSNPTYLVYTREHWDTAWTPQPHLLCDKLTRGTLPKIESASLRWNVGTIKQVGEQFAQEYEEVWMVGNYVRIVSEELDIDWVGQVVSQGEVRFGDKEVAHLPPKRTIAVEDQTFTVLHISWLLAQSQVDSSVVYDSSAEGNIKRVKRAYGYNNGLGDTRTFDISRRWNRSKLDAPDSQGENTPVFAARQDEVVPWNGYQIIKNLLAFHGPRDHYQQSSPTRFEIDPDAEQYLNFSQPRIRTEGRSVLDVINDVIDIRRGLVAWFTFHYPNNPNVVRLHVSSCFPSDIPLPSGKVMPRALDLQTYNFDNEVGIKHVAISEDAKRYDKVTVRGALRTSTFTASIYGGSLVEGWDKESEDAYKVAASSKIPSKNDRFRSSVRFDRVYQAFVIPDDWDGKTGGVTYPASKVHRPLRTVLPYLVPGSQDDSEGSEQFTVYGMRMQRVTPLKAGWDYKDATKPIDPMKDSRVGEPEQLPCFAVAEHHDKFVFLDKSDGHTDEDYQGSSTLETSFSLRPMSGEPGLEVRPSSGLPHALALNHFNPRINGGNASRTEVSPVVDFENILFTIAAEFDAYCEGVYPGPPHIVRGSPIAELVIYVGDNVRLDWLVQGTVIDIDKDGKIKTVEQGGPIQDDRRICEDIAKVAYEWYSLIRAKMTIEYNHLDAPAGMVLGTHYGLPVGTLITSIGTPDSPSQRSVNASVTQVVHNLEKGTVVMTASYAEIDFRTLVSG